jgi:hypothetical protein
MVDDSIFNKTKGKAIFPELSDISFRMFSHCNVQLENISLFL